MQSNELLRAVSAAHLVATVNFDQSAAVVGAGWLKPLIDEHVPQDEPDQELRKLRNLLAYPPTSGVPVPTALLQTLIDRQGVAEQETDDRPQLPDAAPLGPIFGGTQPVVVDLTPQADQPAASPEPTPAEPATEPTPTPEPAPTPTPEPAPTPAPPAPQSGGLDDFLR